MVWGGGCEVGVVTIWDHCLIPYPISLKDMKSMWDGCGIKVGSIWDGCGINVGWMWDQCGNEMDLGPTF